jgi:choline dehydrogenase-like flavoprotein
MRDGFEHASLRKIREEHVDDQHYDVVVIGTGAASGTLGHWLPPATAHQAGTVRFCTDPAPSVLDPMCKAHDLVERLG